jgi:GTP-binding protein
MFVDECVIKVSAGDGGRGCIAFRREKYEPWGGPNGGDGGSGGDVVLLGSHDTNNLVDYKFKQHWKGGRGEHGLGKDGRVVAEVVVDGQRIVLCKGGNGGWGNTHFKTSTNRAPNRANPGQPGEQGEFRLVLKSIADVGLVGFPNAGKSSLTNAITKAHPKTAAYPFTTLHPQIGVIEFKDEVRGDKRILLADIPGLIEGASENRGLGHRFLRHVERCALLLIIVDMAGNDGRDPREDYRQLLNELKLYDPELLKKPRLLASNKMDLPAAAENLAKFKRRYKVDAVEISCLEGAGLERLKKELLKRVTLLRRKEKVSPAAAA